MRENLGFVALASIIPYGIQNLQKMKSQRLGYEWKFFQKVRPQFPQTCAVKMNHGIGSRNRTIRMLKASNPSSVLNPSQCYSDSR